jgi:nucleotide-binding universal stress UspA family protein
VARGGYYYAETRGEARARAQQAANRLRLAGVDASATVRNARRERIPAAILAEAAALDVSVIVLGTRARGALSAAMVGSTSAAVARRSSRPVILVKASARGHRHVGRWGSPAVGGATGWW